MIIGRSEAPACLIFTGCAFLLENFFIMLIFTNIRKKFYYWHLLVSLIVLRYMMLAIIQYYQYQYISQESVPENLNHLLDREMWEALRVKELEKFKLVFAENFAKQSLDLVLVGFGVLPRLWEWTGSIFRSSKQKNIYWRSLLLYFSYWIMNLAVSLFFNAATVSSKPKFVFNFFEMLIPIVTILGTKLIIKKNKWKRTSIFILLAIIIFSLLSMLYLPFSLSKDIPPFPPGPIKESIQALIGKFGFPVDRIYLKKDEQPNASTLGIGSMGMIVVHDSLIKLLGTGRELMAVMCHEIGHWYYNHSLLGLLETAILVSLKIVAYFYIIDRPRFYKALELRATDSPILPLGLGMVFFEIILHQVDFLILPLRNYISWVKEYQADRFSVNQGYGEDLYWGLLMLDLTYGSLSTVAYGIFYSTHPVMSSRLAAIDRLMKNK